MRGLTLYEPWASLVAIGAKKIETRPWATQYRGLIAIHAAMKWEPWQRQFAAGVRVLGYQIPPDDELPFGRIVAVATLVSCVSVQYADASPEERGLGDYTLGRTAWVFGQVWALAKPIACRGARRLWYLDPATDQALRAALAPIAARDIGAALAPHIFPEKQRGVQ